MRLAAGSRPGATAAVRRQTFLATAAGALVAAIVVATIALLESRYGDAYYARPLAAADKWRNIGWCGRRDLVEKLASSASYYVRDGWGHLVAGIKILEAVRK